MDESPIASRTPRSSRYSLYQSDYETAAEDSDGSLYYSLLDDGELENDSDDKENHQITPRNGLSSRRTLREQCLQKNINHTPRNEFNKRVSFNVAPLTSPTSMPSPTTAFLGGFGLFRNENTKRLKNWESSSLPNSSSTMENVTEMFDSLNRATINDRNDSDILEVSNEDLNSTITEEATNAVETISEASEEVKDEAIDKEPIGTVAVTTTTTVYINLKTTGIPCGPKRLGPASSNRNIPSTSGLSNLPVPQKISIAELTNPPTVATKNSHGASSYKKMSQFHGRSTENHGYSKPNGKSGIPKVSLMLARNNSALHTSVLPSSSSLSKCEYCDKTFAKKSILDGHLLEKCEKIPPARHRQLSRQHSYPN